MARFARQGARYLDTKDKWERLAFMQHYGVPTKLMDWTTNPTAAIYFALAFRAESRKELDKPHIWVLNPFGLNGLSGPRIIFDNMDEPTDLKLERQSGHDWPHKWPIAIAVDWRNIRIEHQQGVFTYHGKCTESLDKLDLDDSLGKVEIEDGEIDDLTDHLRDAGVTHFRMLQDPDSLGKDITESALRRDILWGSGRTRLISEGGVEEENRRTDATV